MTYENQKNHHERYWRKADTSRAGQQCQFTNANSMPSMMPSTKSHQNSALEVWGGEFIT